MGAGFHTTSDNMGGGVEAGRKRAADKTAASIPKPLRRWGREPRSGEVAKYDGRYR